jgi:uncharacterized membrane protein YeiB
MTPVFERLKTMRTLNNRFILQYVHFIYILQLLFGALIGVARGSNVRSNRHDSSRPLRRLINLLAIADQQILS